MNVAREARLDDRLNGLPRDFSSWKRADTRKSSRGMVKRFPGRRITARCVPRDTDHPRTRAFEPAGTIHQNGILPLTTMSSGRHSSLSSSPSEVPEKFSSLSSSKILLLTLLISLRKKWTSMLIFPLSSSRWRGTSPGRAGAIPDPSRARRRKPRSQNRSAPCRRWSAAPHEREHLAKGASGFCGFRGADGKWPDKAAPLSPAESMKPRAFIGLNEPGSPCRLYPSRKGIASKRSIVLWSVIEDRGSPSCYCCSGELVPVALIVSMISFRLSLSMALTGHCARVSSPRHN